MTHHVTPSRCVSYRSTAAACVCARRCAWWALQSTPPAQVCARGCCGPSARVVLFKAAARTGGRTLRGPAHSPRAAATYDPDEFEGFDSAGAVGPATVMDDEDDFSGAALPTAAPRAAAPEVARVGEEWRARARTRACVCVCVLGGEGSVTTRA